LKKGEQRSVEGGHSEGMGEAHIFPLNILFTLSQAEVNTVKKKNKERKKNGTGKICTNQASH